MNYPDIVYHLPHNTALTRVIANDSIVILRTSHLKNNDAPVCGKCAKIRQIIPRNVLVLIKSKLLGAYTE